MLPGARTFSDTYRPHYDQGMPEPEWPPAPCAGPCRALPSLADMSVRNLQYLFKPNSVAVFSDSSNPESLGAVLRDNSLGGGFSGLLMPVNPRHAVVKGINTYGHLRELPAVPDLAVIATPQRTIPRLVSKLGEIGTRAAILIATGVSQSSEQRARFQQEILDAARPHLLRIIGPNCLGVMVPPLGLNASCAHRKPAAGNVAFIARSGPIVTSMLDWALSQRVGFSHLVSLGDMSDVDFGDILDYLATDRRTSAIMLYIEAVTHVRKFMSAARAAARMKPVIVVKAGRHTEGSRVLPSHTGAAIPSDIVYDEAFRRAGLLRVLTLQELFDAVETLAMDYRPVGDRLAIITNDGGMGTLATDALIDYGGQLAGLSPETIKRLDALLPPAWSRGNPIHIVGDAPDRQYRDAITVLADDPGVDATLAVHCPTAVASAKKVAQAVAESTVACHRQMVLTSWIGEGTVREARDFLADRQIPSMETPEQAVRAFMHLVHYQHNQTLLIETPPSVPEHFDPDNSRAQAVLKQVLAEGRTWLTEPEANEVLAAYAIPVVPTRFARDAKEAARLAKEINGPVALKIISPDIIHKSDIGGVELNLTPPEAVRYSADRMLGRLRTLKPRAAIEGFSVQPMVKRLHGVELLMGATEDQQFGPVVLFGRGGTIAEQVADTATALPPLNMLLAREAIERTRVFRLLKGYRNQPAVNLNAVAVTLIKIAQLICDCAELAELDINPLIADPDGVLALNVRIRLSAATGPAVDRLVIRPYPRELEYAVVVEGAPLLVRPIRPEDEPALQTAVEGLTQQEIRLRFFAPIKTLTHATAARFTQLDYDRDMALVLATPAGTEPAVIFGLAQLSVDPDFEHAEYAVFVRHDMQGKGVATLLSCRLIDYARSRGIGEIYADILNDNTAMLGLARKLGFECVSLPGERDVVHATLNLGSAKRGIATL